MSYQSLVFALKKRREAAGLTQQDAAKTAGVSLKTYQRIERGDSDIRLSQYKAIIAALKITDLDVSLDMINIAGATPWDVAAAARTLPRDARTLLVSLIMMMHRERDK